MRDGKEANDDNESISGDGNDGWRKQLGYLSKYRNWLYNMFENINFKIVLLA